MFCLILQDWFGGLFGHLDCQTFSYAELEYYVKLDKCGSIKVVPDLFMMHDFYVENQH